MSTNTDTKYTMEDVAEHNTDDAAWTTINGKVYDVTAWINEHPGGAKAIEGLVGKDGTDKFQRTHGGHRGPEAMLAKLQIGVLAE